MTQRGRTSMRSSWRSWFWNSVLLVIMAMMTGIVAWVAVDQTRRHVWPAAIGFGLATGWTGVAMVRSLFVGVYARPRGVVIRGPWLSKTIPWNEITEITAGGLTSGAGETLGATSVIVMRRRPGAVQPRPVELGVLGGYGLSPKRPTPADRAIADLTAHLERWR